MNTFRWLFRIRRDERWMALVVTLVLTAMHALVIGHYNHIFMDAGPGYWARFLHHFHLSGYDPITYSVVTAWTAKYNVFRHPLLAFFVAPLCWLNNALLALTGVNCVQYVVAAVWIVFGLYAFLFAYRIQREIVGLPRTAAILLATMLFGFGHVMVAAVAPDHFILSLAMLLLVAYVCGTRMQQGRPLSIRATVVLFVATAGITLSNGVKVFLCALFTNGRRFFRPTYLLLAVLLPSALLWTTARVEYRHLVLPQEKAAHAKKAREQQLAQATARLDSVRHAKPKARRNPYGKPIAQKGFMRWTDITTSRTDALVHNVFGEGIQLHDDHVLGDVLRHRPVIVKYGHAVNYVVEALLVLLFLLGILSSFFSPLSSLLSPLKNTSFLLMLLACVAFDMLLHLGLGFGLNEVYIMSCHWIFIIPIAIGYLLRAPFLRERTLWSNGLLVLCATLTVWLWAWNLSLMAGFLL